MNDMKNHAFITISSSFILSLMLVACSNQLTYQDEPTAYQKVEKKAAISYLALAFPVNNPQQLALQLSLVKHKKQAAKQERWLLLHHVPYKWLWVEWQGEQFYLLAAGPFDSGHRLAAQRRMLQQGLVDLSSMPAIALSVSKSLSSQALAKRGQGSEAYSN